MSTNYGFINNIATGIKEGLIAEQTAKKNAWDQQQLELANQRNQQQQDFQNQLSLKTHGLIKTDSGLQDDPERQLEEQLKGKQTQSGLDELDPDSETSQRAYGFLKNSMESAKKGSSMSLPEKMSGAQVKEMMPLVKTDIGGVYGLLGKQASEDSKEKSLDSREKMQAQRQWNGQLGDSSQAIQRLNGATRINDLMDAAERGELKTNQALLGQLNAEISRLETGSQSPALGQAEKTELNSFAAQLGALKDKMSSNVSSVDLKPQIDQIRAVNNNLAKSYVQQAEGAANTLEQGATDSQLEVFKAKHEGLKNRYKGLIAPSAPSSKTLAPEDQQAISWANANKESKDPSTAQKAIQILKIHGM